MGAEESPKKVKMTTVLFASQFRLALWGVFALTLTSGIFLMVYYLPHFGQAFSSVDRLNEQVPFG